MEKQKALSLGNIREVLWEEVAQLKSGNTSPANVNAICNATGKILSSVKIEMEFAKLTGQAPRIDMLAAPELKAEAGKK